MPKTYQREVRIAPSGSSYQLFDIVHVFVKFVISNGIFLLRLLLTTATTAVAITTHAADVLLLYYYY